MTFHRKLTFLRFGEMLIQEYEINIWSIIHFFDSVKCQICIRRNAKFYHSGKCQFGEVTKHHYCYCQLQNTIKLSNLLNEKKQVKKLHSFLDVDDYKKRRNVYDILLIQYPGVVTIFNWSRDSRPLKITIIFIVVIT